MRRREFIAGLVGAAAWPLVAHAQQPPPPVIGFMSTRSPEDSEQLVAAFRRGLGESGFIEGQNVTIEFRWARGQYDRLPTLAAELVSRRVSVIAAVGGDPSPIAAKRATSTIPIVFTMGTDPVIAGLVESFNRPGGNATGYTIWTDDMEPKRLGLLRDLAPGTPVVGVLLNPNYPPAARQLQDIEAAAPKISHRVFVAKASNDAELSAALTALLGERVGALLVTADPYFDARKDQIIAFAAQHRLPAMYWSREYPVAGGLISYGPNLTDAYRQAGIYAGLILKGAKPADLPVVQPTKFEFVINLKAARVLGIEVPPALLAIADEAIE
jgi:putative ABC transport system substrate-binding protein